MSEITPGLSATLEWVVEEKYCTRRGEFQIFSTPNLVLFIEAVAIDALAPHLAPGEACVGTKVDIAHMGATLLGQTVTATVTVTEVDRRRVAFDVEVHDDKEVVAKGSHERFVINVDKFTARLADKAASLG